MEHNHVGVSLGAVKRTQVMYIIQAMLEYLVSIVVSSTFLVNITKELGMSDSLTAIISAIISLGQVFQLGSLALRQHKVKGMVIGLSILNQLLFMALYIIPLFGGNKNMKIVIFTAVIIAAYLFYNVVHPKKINWFMSFVNDDIRGRFTSVKEAISLVAGVAFNFAIGAVIDHYEAKGDMRTAFVISAIAICVLTVLHTLTMILSSEKELEAPEYHGKEKLSRMLSTFKDKNIIKVSIIFALWYVSRYCATPFYGTYQRNELGFSMVFISVLSLIYSAVRVAFGFYWGSFADKFSFAKMLTLCMIIESVGYLIAVFMVPSNGKFFYTAYYICEAISMAGANSALINLVYDYVSVDRRSDAIAVTQTIAGIIGFVTTLGVSPLVSYIQKAGNTLFGFNVYAQQVLSAIAFVVTALLVVYLKVTLNSGKSKQRLK